MSDVRYVYVRNVPRKRSKKGETTDITVAYRFDDENQQVVYNSAERGKKDFFRRATGRSVAGGRLKANPESHPNSTILYSEVSTTGGPKYNLISNRMQAIFGGNNYGRAKKTLGGYYGSVTAAGIRNSVPELEVRPEGVRAVGYRYTVPAVEPQEDYGYENPENL